MANIIELDILKQGFPGLSPTMGAAHVEACIVCLENQSHDSGVEIVVQGLSEQRFQVIWHDIIDEQIKRTWHDLTIATEWAACGITFLIMQQLKGLVVVQQSRKGGGFDYWLGEPQADAALIQKQARLEVSGILKAEYSSQIRARVRQKITQIKPTDDELLEFVAVVEFARPTIWVEQKT